LEKKAKLLPLTVPTGNAMCSSCPLVSVDKDKM
jgi:hypothetical protein